jgi:hypothetical protein
VDSAAAAGSRGPARPGRLPPAPARDDAPQGPCSVQSGVHRDRAGSGHPRARSGCCRAGQCSCRLSDFTAERVRAFLAFLEAEPHNGIATRNARLAALHTLARFLATERPAVSTQYRGSPTQRQRTGVRKDRSAIESRRHGSPPDGFKLEPFRRTVCKHRDSPRIAEGRCCTTAFADSQPRCAQLFEKSGPRHE